MRRCASLIHALKSVGMALIHAFSRRKMILLLIAAAAVRIVILLAFPSVFAFEQTGTIHGSSSYDSYARNLIDTGVYGLTPGVPDALIPPLYSYVLAAVYAIFGRGSLQVGVFHTALDLISILLLADITRRLFAYVVDERIAKRADWIGWLAGVFYAFYPYLIFQNLTLIDTPLFITLLYAFLWLVVLLRDEDTTDNAAWGLALLAGVVLGLAALTRPVIAFLAVLLPLWFLCTRSFTTTLIRLGVIAVISVMTLVPWMARNYSLYDQFVAISTTAGSNFYQGNNDDVIPFLRAGYDAQWTAPAEGEITAPDPNSPEADQQRFALGLRYLQENQAAIPELLWVKFQAHWSIDIFPRLNPTESGIDPALYAGAAEVVTGENGIDLSGVPQGDPVAAYSGGEFTAGRFVHRYYFGMHVVLAVIGIVLSLRDWRDVSLLWLIQISMTIAYAVIFHPSTRYRAPTDPLLFVFAAYTLVWAWVKIARSK